MICTFCQKKARWVDNILIYGKRYGKSYMAWWCKDCDAYVGCHKNTQEPLGTMANKELREWRVKAHEAIDPLWQIGNYSRKKVYLMLKDAFGEEVHVGKSDVEQCKEIIKTIPILFGISYKKLTHPKAS